MQSRKSAAHSWPLVALILQGILAWICVGPASAVQARASDPPQSSAAETEDEWNVIYFGQDRIGYGRSRTQTMDVGKDALLRGNTEQHYKMKRFGQLLEIDEWMEVDEGKDGSLRSFKLRMKNFASGEILVSGNVDGRTMKLSTTTAGRPRESKTTIDPALKSPMYEDRFLSNPAIKPGEKRSFETFLPQLNKVSTVSAVGEGTRKVTMHDGTLKDLLEVRISYSAMPTMRMRAYVDKDGTTQKSEMDSLGSTLILYRVPKSVALEAIAGNELDLAVSTLVRVQPLKRGHKSKKAVYRITIPDDLVDDFPTSPTQTVKQLAPNRIELTVTAPSPPTRKDASQAPSEFLDESPYLESTDPRVVEHARRAAAGALDAWSAALKMERYVHDKVANKNFSTAMASAGEVAKSLEGDCTEHAVLLAAMLRAQKIPSRVAVGLVYAEQMSSFAGHMWTEVFFDDRWIPLDATLGQGGIGAAHIKLGDSSMSDDAPTPAMAFLPLLNLIGNMKIDVVSAE